MYPALVNVVRWVGDRLRRAGSVFLNAVYSVSDPALARIFHFGLPNYSGAEVHESSAMAISAFYRAVSLVAGTIGTLDLNQHRKNPDTGLIETINTAQWVQAPGGPFGPTPMSWKETIVAHMMVHGDAFLHKVMGGGGQLFALEIVHPLCVSVEWARPGDDPQPVGGKWFRVTLLTGEQVMWDAQQIVHIPGLSLDGLRGCSVIAYGRNSLGTTIAADRSAAKLFSNGALVSGLVTSEDDIPPGDEDKIREHLDNKVAGWENAGGIPFINRKLKFQQWQMSATDAQFLQSRAFQIEEIARWTGVPPHLLMQTDKQTSWGTGVEEQNNGLSRFTLHVWTSRMEQALSRLTPTTQWIQFDYASLERPTPEDEINLLVVQVNAKLLTVDEARAKLNRPPLPKDATPAPPPPPPPAPAADPAQEPATEGAPA